MIPDGWAAVLKDTTIVECAAASGGGVYGTVQSRPLDPGVYLVRSTATVAIRDTQESTLGAYGREVEVTASVPLVVEMKSGYVQLATTTSALGGARVWLIPLRRVCA